MQPAVAIALVVYVVASVVAFAVFAWDKRAAARGGRRVPERTLHGLELLGGWPGAIAAILILHHKNRKPSFWLVTAGIALAHACAWLLALRLSLRVA